MDFTESDEHAEIRAAVGAIAAKFGPKYYAEHARERTFPDDLWRTLGESGFLGVNIAEEHGGGGGGLVELALLCEALAAEGTPILLLVVNSAICAEVIGEFGSPELRRRWLPGLADGTTRMVFAITEPDAGSNSHQLTTRARRDGDEWVLSGTKYYISGVDTAEALVVVARSGQDASGRNQLSLFVVPTDAPGLEVQPLPVDIMVPERQFTLHFDDVRVPHTSLVGVEHEGFRQVFHGLNPERITGAALCVGMGRFALRQAAAYATDRQVWGVPIGTHQGISHPLAEAAINVELAALMTQKAAWLHDRGLPAGEASNMAKFAAADAAIAAIDTAVQAHGGNGLSKDYGLLPYWGLARLLRIAPVSREMILNYVAQHTLHLPRSY
jgi:alkylation response protein AidB-like acyl-CoA dehydrogenase